MPPLPPPTATPPSTTATTRLLRRAYSPETTTKIHTDKFHSNTLPLLPTSSAASATPPTTDARQKRRDARNKRLIAQGKRRRKRSQPLSAAERRRLCIYDIPKAERKYELYLGLNRLWNAYAREILLGWPQPPPPSSGGTSTFVGVAEEEVKWQHLRRLREGPIHVDPQQAGAKMASADFHGAEICCVRSSCVGRVGVKGIVVRDTMKTFEVVTRGDCLKVLPKEGCVFRVEVGFEDLEGDEEEGEQGEGGRAEGEKKVKVEKKEEVRRPPLVFEIYGEQFKVRAPDRANKKFRLHVPKDL